MNARSCSDLVVLCALVGLWAGAPAVAQTTYRCSVDGRSVLSDKPCTTGPGTRLSGYGPIYRDPTPGRQGYTAPVVRAPDHLQYLSPACAELNDALRTAPSRGVGHAVQRDLQAEYQSRCAEDDRSARQQLAQDQSDQRAAQRGEREARATARALSQRERDQCHEMLRILHGKRQRAPELSAGEQADLQRFEANYNGRCKG